MSGHVDDRAALYALGALEEGEAASVRTHIAECVACAQAVGAAEADVAFAASLEPRLEAPVELGPRIERLLSGGELRAIDRRRQLSSSASPWLAAAAAFVIGVLPSSYFFAENRRMHNAMTVQSAAMDRLASSTHRVAAFRPMPKMPEGSSASVAYAASGDWYVIVVKDVSRTLSVAWMHDGEQTMLGQAVPHGDVAMLYLPKSHRMDQLALMDGAQVVAQASLRY
ncbi:MAG TPA: zf-HC2 domain-containing protein [Candidatus Cybelea sp.]